MNKHILIIDDLLPNPSYGAGHVRAYDIVKELMGLGFNILFYARGNKPMDKMFLSQMAPKKFSAHYLNRTSLEEVLHQHGASLHTVWVSRMHNIETYGPLLSRWVKSHPECMLLADIEALTRLVDVSHTLNVYDAENMPFCVSKTAPALKNTASFYHFVCVNQFEAKIVAQACPSVTVSILGHKFQAKKAKMPFFKRKNFLFLGAFHASKSPNMHSLYIFCTHVWPRIKEVLPEAEFHVAGYMTKQIEFPKVVKENAKIMGFVERIDQFVEQYRVFVAPTRLAAGIPHKVQQSMALGIPAVISDILANQLPVTQGTQPFLHTTLGSPAYAEACIDLYTKASLWRRVQRDGWDNITEYCSSEEFDNTVKRLMLG